jgi:hypothetical protein
MCWNYQGTMVLQESKAKSWWTICIGDFDIETWSTSSIDFILTANKKMWAYKQALYICWFFNLFSIETHLFKKTYLNFTMKLWIMFFMSDLKKLMWCCYPNFILVLQFWSTLHATYFWATIFFGQKITSPCTKNHFQFFAYIVIKGFCSMFSRCGP